MLLASTTGWLLSVAVVVAVIVPVFVVLVYNSLAKARVRMQNSFSQIDVQLKRRFDLIPNLVEAVKGYMAHERQTLEAVTQARKAAMDGLAAIGPLSTVVAASRVDALSNSVGVFDGALRRLCGLVEAYPDLKASTNVMQLQEELTSTENRVAFARQSYNDSVMRYNTMRVVFPQSLIAGAFAFTEGALFGASESERALPLVKL